MFISNSCIFLRCASVPRKFLEFPSTAGAIPGLGYQVYDIFPTPRTYKFQDIKIFKQSTQEVAAIQRNVTN